MKEKQSDGDNNYNFIGGISDFVCFRNNVERWIMKNFLITVCIVIILALMGWGLGSYIFGDRHCNTAEAEEIVNGSFGRFKILEEQSEYRDSYGCSHYQYLVYDEATYIIYVYDETAEQGASISPYYCMNADNEPEIAVYWDGMKE